MDAGSLSKRLEVLSFGILRVVVFEQAVSGLSSIRTNSMFLSKIAGFNQVFAYCFLAVIYAFELTSVIGLCIPAVRDTSFKVAVIYASLSVALAVEAVIAVAADDDCNRTKTLLLTAACLKHTVSAACSRRLCVYAGSVGDDSLTDRISSGLRERASRYKLAPTACIVMLIGFVWTVLYSENPLSSAPLSRMLGRSQYARGMAAASLLSAVGSEDRSRTTIGRKKSL